MRSRQRTHPHSRAGEARRLQQRGGPPPFRSHSERSGARPAKARRGAGVAQMPRTDHLSRRRTTIRRRPATLNPSKDGGLGVVTNELGARSVLARTRGGVALRRAASFSRQASP